MCTQWEIVPHTMQPINIGVCPTHRKKSYKYKIIIFASFAVLYYEPLGKFAQEIFLT